MIKYRTPFLLCLFLTNIFVLLHRLFEITPALAGYAFIFQLLFIVSWPVAYVVYFMAIKQALLTVHLSGQIDALKEEEKLQHQQAQNLSELRQNAQETHAEVFGHIKTLKSLLHQDDIAQASLKLNELSEHFNKMQVHPICSDNLLNAILQDRKELAERNHIAVNYRILLPGQLHFPDSVLSTIFFNLLDNGIEACMKSCQEQPFLTLTVKYTAHFLHINMENSKCADTVFNKKTTKSGSGFHGYGLIIMEELTDKYDGSCEWIDKGNTFQSLLMLRTDGS